MTVMKSADNSPKLQLSMFLVCFELQVVVVLEAIIGRTLEQSLVEVLEEEVRYSNFV